MGHICYSLSAYQYVINLPVGTAPITLINKEITTRNWPATMCPATFLNFLKVHDVGMHIICASCVPPHSIYLFKYMTSTPYWVCITLTHYTELQCTLQCVSTEPLRSQKLRFIEHVILLYFLGNRNTFYYIIGTTLFIVNRTRYLVEI